MMSYHPTMLNRVWPFVVGFVAWLFLGLGWAIAATVVCFAVPRMVKTAARELPKLMRGE